VTCGIALFEDALPRRKVGNFDLIGQNTSFIVVEKLEKRDVA
jgi:hypothetical protein